MYQDLEEDIDDDDVADGPMDHGKDKEKHRKKRCQTKTTASWVHHQNLEGEPHL